MAKGEPTGGIHRTFLLDDGSAKAPPGKKMLGPVAGGSVRLFPMTPDGHLGIAEGIETALAAHRIFGIPVWAALSADGVRALAVARRRHPRDDLRRCRRCRTSGGGDARRSAQQCRDCQPDRSPAPWR